MSLSLSFDGFLIIVADITLPEDVCFFADCSIRFLRISYTTSYSWTDSKRLHEFLWVVRRCCVRLAGGLRLSLYWADRRGRSGSRIGQLIQLFYCSFSKSPTLTVCLRLLLRSLRSWIAKFWASKHSCSLLFCGLYNLLSRFLSWGIRFYVSLIWGFICLLLTAWVWGRTCLVIIWSCSSS